MNLIVNVNNDWAISNGDNKLLVNIPGDMKFFKERTMGKTVIYGRKTLDSMGTILPGRKNIVITNTLSNISDDVRHSADYFVTVPGSIVDATADVDIKIMTARDQTKDGYEKVHSNNYMYPTTSLFLVRSPKIAVALANMIELDTDNIYVIGGESIYKAFYSQCKYAYVTKNSYPTPSTTGVKYFPNLDEDENWYNMDGFDVSPEGYKTTYIYIPKGCKENHNEVWYTFNKYKNSSLFKDKEK